MPRPRHPRPILGIGKVVRRPAKCKANPWIAFVSLHDSTFITKVFDTEEAGVEWVKSFNT